MTFCFRSALIKYILIFTLCLLFCTVCAAGVESNDAILDFSDDSAVPWHIAADEISYDSQLSQYLATGNVSISKNQKKITSDFIRFDHKTNKIIAIGHVLIITGKDSLSADKVEFDLNTETGILYNSTVFLSKNHFYIKGKIIRKTGKNIYTAEQATATTCEGKRPDWRISGKKIRVTIEGYGFASHATLQVKNIPVLYTPYMVFPVKLKRQTGLLLPQFGYSDRKGAEYIQPLFWAINPYSDATFYNHFMDKRGNKFGLEYRYILSEQARGTFMFDGLKDQKTDLTTDDSHEWGYEDDSVSRPNKDRYWLRTKIDQPAACGFMARLDLDIVSDQDYLNEFKHNYTGFDETKKYFNNTFGRDIDLYDDSSRINSFNLSKNWGNYSLNAETLWYDNVINRRQNDTDFTLQQLPAVQFKAIKQQLFQLPLYYSGDSEYTYFYRQDGSTGHRLDIYPRIYFPLNFRNYFAFEPSAGLRETIWYPDHYDEFEIDQGEFYQRQLYDIKTDLSSSFYNIYNLSGKNPDKIKHTLNPRIIYLYIPEIDQDQNPYYNSIDRIEEKNLITYSLTNTFTARSSIKKSNSVVESDLPYEHHYQEFLRLKIEQSFDINKARDNQPEPFSEISGELEISPKNYISLTQDTTWSSYENELTGNNIGIKLWDSRKDHIFIEHRFKKDISESLLVNMTLRITNQFTMRCDYERNLFENKDIRSGIGVTYKKQCWALDLDYNVDNEEQRYSFMIHLTGLGGVGN